MARTKYYGDSGLRYLYLLVLLPLALASGHSAAQVNIEALRGDTDAAGFSGALALNLEMHTGNTDLKEIGLEGRLDFDHPRVHTFLLARNDFGWEQGERFADEGLIHLRQHYPCMDGSASRRSPSTIMIRPIGSTPAHWPAEGFDSTWSSPRLSSCGKALPPSWNTSG